MHIGESLNLFVVVVVTLSFVLLVCVSVLLRQDLTL